MKFNFDVLSPIEFEELCKDIISKKLDMDFKSFKLGKDGGIDLRNKEKGVICQCKHIKNYNNLINNLKKEVEKFKFIENMNEYYLMVSTSLTPKNEDDILELMANYLKSSSQLISIKEIEAFLECDDNEALMNFYIRNGFKFFNTRITFGENPHKLNQLLKFI